MTKETMWRYVVLYAALAWLSVSGPVFAQEPSPPLGQIVGWKSFSVASTYYEMPAAAKATWFQTNFPQNPTFIKQYKDTGLLVFCHV